MAVRTRNFAADEIAKIEELMSDLEARLRRLNGVVKKEAAGASNEVGDFVSEALGNIADRVREGARTASRSVSDVTRASGGTLRRFGEEVEHRPLLILAIAAGIGLLIGLAARR